MCMRCETKLFSVGVGACVCEVRGESESFLYSALCV